MLVQKSMIGKSLIFRLTNRPEDIGDIKVTGTEFELVMPAPENQMKERLRGACGGILKVKR